MALLTGCNFDSSRVDPTDSSYELPVGQHLVAAVDSYYRPTRKGDGMRLAFTLRVLDGPHSERSLSIGFNMRHPNSDVVAGAQGGLASMCRACGYVGKLPDSSILHGLPFLLTVEARRKADGGTSTEVVRYDPPPADTPKLEVPPSETPAPDTSSPSAGATCGNCYYWQYVWGQRPEIHGNIAGNAAPQGYVSTQVGDCRRYAPRPAAFKAQSVSAEPGQFAQVYERVDPNAPHAFNSVTDFQLGQFPRTTANSSCGEYRSR